MTRLTEAVEQLAKDYATVHAKELFIARTPPSDAHGRFFYQDDKALYEAEQKAKAAATQEDIV